MRWHAAWLVLVTACWSHDPAPVSPPPANVAPRQSPACVDPVADAHRRLDAPPTVALTSEAIDLDGDGHPDTVLHTGGYESEHLLYAGGPCPRFVAGIRAFMLGCESRRTRGMCDLWVETWLMHGDRLSTTWIFDGTTYQSAGEGREIPGPHK